MILSCSHGLMSAGGSSGYQPVTRRGGSVKHKECVALGFFTSMTADNILDFITESYKTWHVLFVGLQLIFQHIALCFQSDTKSLWVFLRKHEVKSVTNGFTGHIKRQTGPVKDPLQAWTDWEASSPLKTSSTTWSLRDSLLLTTCSGSDVTSSTTEHSVTW